MTLGFSSIPQPDSILRCWDPRWKLAATFVFLFQVAFLQRLPPVAVGCLFACSLVYLSRAPRRWLLVRVGALLIFLSPFLLTMPFLVPEPSYSEQSLFHFSWHGAKLGLLMLCKALTVVLVSLTLIVSSPLEDLLKAAHSLRVPGFLVQITLLTYRYVLLMLQELQRVRLALRARAYRNRANAHSYRTIGNVTGMLLVRSQERGERISQAMQARGFDGKYRSLTTFQAGWGDVLGFFLLTGLGAILLWWSF